MQVVVSDFVLISWYFSAVLIMCSAVTCVLFLFNCLPILSLKWYGIGPPCLVMAILMLGVEHTSSSAETSALFQSTG